MTGAAGAALRRHGDLAVLGGLIVLAAALRFISLPTRGMWDSDQGHDMLVLRALVHDGTIPLLGPPTSIGDFHHGALYYFVLAPAAALTGGTDPIAVVGAIAGFGVAAVAVTWWLARSIGGPLAGAIAGLLMAVSASAVDESTFLWNPNLIPLSSSVALACAWRAWTTGRPRWWLGAAAGVAVTMQSHVLGVVLLPAAAAFLLADAARRSAGSDRRAVLQAGLGGLALIALSYAPLVVEELRNGLPEARAALAFLASGGPPSSLDPLTRLLVVGLRILSWPFAGLFTDALPVAIASALLVAALAAWRARSARDDERTGVRWLAATVAWSILALTIGAASLTTVVRELPVDHYHAFLDPPLFVLAGVGLAALATRNVTGRLLATIALVALVGWNAATLPPAIAQDGGWPAAQAAADRILAASGGRLIVLLSLPAIKPPDAVSYPLAITGDAAFAGDVVGGDDAVVVVCDPHFREAIGLDCGGPAEEAAVAGWMTPWEYVVADRFPAAPSRWITVYVPSAM